MGGDAGLTMINQGGQPRMPEGDKERDGWSGSRLQGPAMPKVRWPARAPGSCEGVSVINCMRTNVLSSQSAENGSGESSEIG